MHHIADSFSTPNKTETTPSATFHKIVKIDVSIAILISFERDRDLILDGIFIFLFNKIMEGRTLIISKIASRTNISTDHLHNLEFQISQFTVSGKYCFIVGSINIASHTNTKLYL